MALPRTIERLVEDQGWRCKLEPRSPAANLRRPVVALSRLPGALGEELAQRLCTDLQYDLFDHELIHRIASSAHLSDHLVAALDEKGRSFLTEWLAELVQQQHLSPYGYFHHLTRVVGALAFRGGAVIVGRGAHLILRSGEALRVLVAASLSARVAAVAAQGGIDRGEARRRIEAAERQRRAFLRQYFNAELGDASGFDLVVNPHTLGIEGALVPIKAALTVMARERAAG
jgi:hypothetical protein